MIADIVRCNTDDVHMFIAPCSMFLTNEHFPEGPFNLEKMATLFSREEDVVKFQIPGKIIVKILENCLLKFFD